MAATNIQYVIADRTRAINAGGINAAHLLVTRLGLDEAINERLDLLKVHLPCHESDHVLNIAYNLLAGNSRLEHL
ncbi:MAG: IS1380 family transposase, partial [Pirellulales bacterium]